ncbi:hypothetical protein [Kurthia sibirica]|uniref:Uncharacterized protein n=1 Tax=Kurthia sibirica TaxID=202750 RepID=A0A2U3AJH3_9BACL|nr:hypothetical protein [Kurthia sibirica]PWI24689.1 hypothetical protein DEX24_12030 [Kurthia sibirica]GEK34531.1 hypothetical protein KSI01_20640 [Kurthia sibirica]
MIEVFILLAGLSFLMGVLLLFSTEFITAFLETAHGVGINVIESYGFSSYPMYCFVLGVLFLVSIFFVKLFKKKY